MSHDVLLDVAIRGARGRSEPSSSDREYLDLHSRGVVRDLVGRSGAKPGPAQVYIAKRIRYHLGREAAPPCPNELRGLEEWAQRRAFELVEEAERRLPARDHERDL